MYNSFYPLFWGGPLPKDVDWKEYLTRVIKTSRELYELEYMGKIIEEKFFDSSFLSPCQVEVLDSGREVVWLVIHDRNVKDMEFKIHKNVQSYGESKFARKYTLKSLPEGFLESKPASFRYLWVFMKQLSYSGLGGEPENVASQILNRLMSVVGSEWRRSQVSVIGRSINGLRRSASKLEKKDTREYVEGIAEKIDKALEEIKRIDEHEKKLVSVEKDIVGVRRLMGSSQEFQDWRLMASDVEALKKTHVTKELFGIEIRRLDQKIDSLKEIRFWSKRAVVDIVLAIVATVSTTIATLMAAGIIKF